MNSVERSIIQGVEANRRWMDKADKILIANINKLMCIHKDNGDDNMVERLEVILDKFIKGKRDEE